MAAPTGSEKKGVMAKLAPFPKPFWVINGVELLERGAYYGMLSVLSVFLAQDLGFSPGLLGILLAIQFPLLYFLPVVSGAVAEKFGFQKMLVATFVFLIAGYGVMAIAFDVWTGLLGIVLFGIGAGLFKPMPAATVSDTTTEQDRNFGFAIYYWAINLGAFLAPLAMAQYFGGSFRAYFWVAAAISVANLVISLVIWRDVREAKREVRVGESVKGMRQILKHPAFMVLILIYSGFWFMYAITTSFLQIYAVESNILPDSQVALLVPANALAILIVGPILGKLTGKMPALPLMIAGITIFCAGFLLIGFVPTLIALLAGVFIYSIGEFLTHPSYLSYVTKISPPDKVPMFLGYGFISVGIGQFAGTFAGGLLYGGLATGLGRPQLFWIAIVSVGLATVAALLIYNAVLSRRVADREAPPAAPTRARRPWVGAAALAVLALLAIPALAAVGMSVEPSESTGEVGVLNSEDLLTVALPLVEDATDEGQLTAVPVVLAANATGEATLVLTWTDEAAGGAGQTNAPDSFMLHVKAADGTTIAESDVVANSAGGAGTITLTFPAAPGDYVVEVMLTEAGDVTAGAGPLTLPGGVGGGADTSNAWTLESSHQATA